MMLLFYVMRYALLLFDRGLRFLERLACVEVHRGCWGFQFTFRMGLFRRRGTLFSARVSQRSALEFHFLRIARRTGSSFWWKPR